MQQQPYFQTMWTADPSEYGNRNGNVTMQVALVNLEVLVFELWHLFNDAVDYRNKE
jgi:hypothetical protein